MSELGDNQVVLSVKGRPFRCYECGVNVFFITIVPGIYRCTGCEEQYEGEQYQPIVPPEKTFL